MLDKFQNGPLLGRIDDPDLLDTVLKAIDADVTAEGMDQLPYGIRIIVERVIEFRRTGNPDALADALAGASGSVDLLWHCGLSVQENAKAFERFTHQPALKQARPESDGITVAVSKGERIQLRFDWTDIDVNRAEVHMLVKSTFKSEPVIALRWLPAEGNEEVMLRFRPESLIFARRLDRKSSHRAAYQLLSLVRSDGSDILLLNGVPVIWRTAESGALRGVVLDAIGDSDGENILQIPLFMVGRSRGRIVPEPEVVGELLSQIVASCARKADLNAATGWLTGLEGLDVPLDREAGLALIKANLDQPDGYRDFLEEMVIAKLKERDVPEAQALIAARPPPVLRLRDVTVEIDSNPSKHASMRYLVSKRPDKVALLDGISFDAFNGDIVGIIGKNGAGKSTLLKTLVAAMPLAQGRIECSGRPLLLRPGAGMLGELTGRENVLKTGLYMGFLPNQMRDLMNDIVAFAELEEHIDRPFRYYSDGMRARLIFSLATAIPRDILLLDELLSAGDFAFQRKAMARLDEFLRKAKLVLVVQHTFDFVLSRCTKCLLLDHGKPIFFGDPRAATELYRELA